MTATIEAIVENSESFRWLFFIGLLVLFYFWMQGDNGIEWKDFISSRGADGQYHGDINKLGQSTGIVIGSTALVMVSAAAKDDMTGFAAVLLAYFSFVGGAAGYAAYLRSKVGTTTTTTSTEPAPTAPVKITQTVTEPVKLDKSPKRKGSK